MRGITPVIAIVLLLLMTVAAAGSAFIWIDMIQERIATESEAGLEKELQERHGEFSIETVWNKSNRICMSLRNSGTVPYSESQMNHLSTYVNDKPYRYNTTTIKGMEKFQPQDVINICLCTPQESNSINCVGPTDEGYSYTQGSADIMVEPPIGTGDVYTNFRGT